MLHLCMYVLVEVAAYALQTGIEVSNKDPRPLVSAVYMLEAAIHLETGTEHAPSSLLKV